MIQLQVVKLSRRCKEPIPTKCDFHSPGCRRTRCIISRLLIAFAAFNIFINAETENRLFNFSLLARNKLSTFISCKQSASGIYVYFAILYISIYSYICRLTSDIVFSLISFDIKEAHT